MKRYKRLLFSMVETDNGEWVRYADYCADHIQTRTDCANELSKLKAKHAIELSNRNDEIDELKSELANATDAEAMAKTNITALVVVIVVLLTMMAFLVA
ncbi:MAG: hypothetical protein IBX56_02700 [Methylomicrobium sp.]|nr:hypothetical protein [Methylomicrobium sp.]